jgi:hypothetical protein
VRVAIHQPQYWPWPPYLHKMLAADVFVYLDVAQFNKNGLQNRNRVKTAAGATWLTLPVRHRLGQTIQEVQIADPRAFDKHVKTLDSAYSGAPGYDRWRESLREFFDGRGSSLLSAAVDSTEWLLDRLGAGPRRVSASELENVRGHGSTLVASICATLGATEYLAGRGGLEYMEREHFGAIGCRVSVQEWQSPVYEQRFPQVGFVADLSALDLVLNRPDDASELLESAGGWTLHWDAA